MYTHTHVCIYTLFFVSLPIFCACTRSLSWFFVPSLLIFLSLSFSLFLFCSLFLLFFFCMWGSLSEARSLSLSRSYALFVTRSLYLVHSLSSGPLLTLSPCVCLCSFTNVLLNPYTLMISKVLLSTGNVDNCSQLDVLHVVTLDHMLRDLICKGKKILSRRICNTPIMSACMTWDWSSMWLCLLNTSLFWLF